MESSGQRSPRWSRYRPRDAAVGRGWTYVGFAAHRLAAAESMSVSLPGNEACIVILSGKVTIGNIGLDAGRYSTLAGLARALRP